MKYYENTVDLDGLSMQEAIDLVFDPDTLRQVHGQDMEISEWKNGQRKLHMHFKNLQIPEQVRKCLSGGSDPRVTVKQVIEKSDDPAEHRVKNKVRLHLLGQEFIKVRPRFSLMTSVDQVGAVATRFAASVEVHAIFPPPLNGIVEAFMIQESQNDILKYIEVIEAKRREKQKQNKIFSWNPFHGGDR